MKSLLDSFPIKLEEHKAFENYDKSGAIIRKESRSQTNLDSNTSFNLKGIPKMRVKQITKKPNIDEPLPEEEISDIEEFSEEGIKIPYKFEREKALYGSKNFTTTDSKFAEFQAIAKNSVIMPKPSATRLTRIAKLTNWIEISIKELLDFYNKETTAALKSNCFICPMCQDDYYKDMLKLSDENLMELNDKMMKGKIPIDVVMLSKCRNHFFHKKCIERLGEGNSGFKCPLCDAIYGTLIGDMPEGTMSHKIRSYSCPGFEKHNTIEITYNFPDGIRNGMKYKGTIRIAYLPNNTEGKEILNLLEKAFHRRLLFTIGTSLTTGKGNSIVWNGVHHKTSLIGGATMHGYPDPTYLSRVKEELAAKGVYTTAEQE